MPCAASGRPTLARVDQRRWVVLLSFSAAVGLIALASNITTIAQMSGQANEVLAVRLTISKLVNSGTVWAGLGIVAGWWVGRWTWAIPGAVLACGTALVAHYAVGQAVGLFDATVWLANLLWFVAALLVGPVLGLIGALARHTGPLGTAAALVLPLGAVTEPFLLGMFEVPAILPWPVRMATTVCGVVLVLAGMVGGVAVIRARRPGRRRAIEPVTVGS